MIFHNIAGIALRVLSLCLLAGSVTGCLKEKGTGDCYDPGRERTLTVRAYANTGAEVSPEDITSVYLYFFDEWELFAGTARTELEQTVHLPDEACRIVAWGNLNGNMQTTTGESVDEFGLTLKEATRAASYTALSPDDIFHGMLTLADETRADGDSEVVIPIYRKVGSLTVTVKGLREYTGHADGFSMVVGDTHSSFLFDGSLGGERVSYLPAGGFTDADLYHVAPFNLIPDEDIYIELHHTSGHIATVTHSSDGEPIAVEAGELTNVLIDLTRPIGNDGQLNVSVSLTPWGTLAVWKEF